MTDKQYKEIQSSLAIIAIELAGIAGMGLAIAIYFQYN